MQISAQVLRLARLLRPALGLPCGSMAQGIDMEMAYFAKGRHRVGALLSHAIQIADVPCDQETNLLMRGLERGAVVHDLMQRAAVKHAASILAEANIPGFWIKGIPLGEALYPRSSLRHGKDVDLLVSESQKIEAFDALTKAGYELFWAKQRENPSRTARQLELHHEIGLVHPDRAIQVELHGRLFSVPPQGWSDPEPIIGQDMQAPSLTDPNYALYLILHGAVSNWSRLKWLCDMVRLCDVWDSAMQARIADRAEDLNCLPALISSLRLVEALWEDSKAGEWCSTLSTPIDERLARGLLNQFAATLSGTSVPSALNPIARAARRLTLREPFPKGQSRVQLLLRSLRQNY